MSDGVDGTDPERRLVLKLALRSSCEILLCAHAIVIRRWPQPRLAAAAAAAAAAASHTSVSNPHRHVATAIHIAALAWPGQVRP